jgi:Domain of unknown function (DUF4337)
VSETQHSVEVAETMEHAGTHHKGKGVHARGVGVTMGVLGIVIALCSAFVADQNKGMIRATVQQSETISKEVSGSIKPRAVNLAILNAAHRPVGEVPLQSRVGLIQLSADDKHEREYAKHWAEAYEPLIESNNETSERHEPAEVIAEVALVIGSLALLVSSHVAWALSVIVGLVAIGVTSQTLVTAHAEQRTLLTAIQARQAEYEALRKSHEGSTFDADAISLLDPDGSIRAVIR